MNTDALDQVGQGVMIERARAVTVLSHSRAFAAPELLHALIEHGVQAFAALDALAALPFQDLRAAIIPEPIEQGAVMERARVIAILSTDGAMSMPDLVRRLVDDGTPAAEAQRIIGDERDSGVRT